jgi:phenylacetate-CoA ligase
MHRSTTRCIDMHPTLCEMGPRMPLRANSASPTIAAPDRCALETAQLRRVRQLLAEILPRNRFYARKFAGLDTDLRTLDDLARLPFTTKADLSDDQAAAPPFGTNLTYPVEQYCRLHQTSGTSGKPLRWLDTRASWAWMLDCWDHVYDAAEVRPGDRLFFPFSFGPFLGFWTAFDAAGRRGLLALPGGGLSSPARLRFLLDLQATVVLCTPTYAQHLAEVARAEGINLAGSAVRAVIVAGEPGGSIGPTRARIESGWGARVFDHSGMTEIGPTTVECVANPAGLHLIEAEYLAEVVEPGGDRPVPPGEAGELILTNLGRWGSPLVRYRTGDLVKVDPEPCPCGRPWRRLAGGILGRVDDMIHVRGNNLYPAALEAVLRRLPEVAEYRVELDATDNLTALRIEVEPTAAGLDGLAERVEQAVRRELLFRAEVRVVEPGSLPRFEMKAKRIHHKGTKNTK